MIHIKGLGKYYGDTKVLNDISLDVEEGDVFGIVGHSGAGKSTLLRCMTRSTDNRRFLQSGITNEILKQTRELRTTFNPLKAALTFKRLFL